jgi:hypothetical protein
MVAELKCRDFEPHLVSGDSRGTTEAVAQQLGAESFHTQVLPVQKAQVIREWREGGAVVATVGDWRENPYASSVRIFSSSLSSTLSALFLPSVSNSLRLDPTIPSSE